MASKYIIVLLVLFVTGFLTMGVKRLLLLRAGFAPKRKQSNWLIIALLMLMSVLMLSCSKKAEGDQLQEADTGTERKPVVVTQSDEKTSTVHKQVDNKGNVTATVTISTRSNNNEIITEEKVINGTRSEVEAKIKELDKK